MTCLDDAGTVAELRIKPRPLAPALPRYLELYKENRGFLIRSNLTIIKIIDYIFD